MAAPKKTGFDRPLKVDIVSADDIKSLRALLAKHSPIGKNRSQTIRGVTRLATGSKRGTRGTFTYSKAFPPRGRLRKSWFKSGVVTKNRAGNIVLRNPLPYARALDLGRRKVTITPKSADNLMFKIGNRIIFAKSVTQKKRPPTNSGRGIVVPAVREWVTRRNIKTGKRGITVKWAPFRG